MKKKIKIFVVISVLLNILMGGVLLGNMYRNISWHSQTMAIYESKLPENKKLEVKEVLTMANKNNQEARDKMRDMRDESMSILTADNFDEAAYDAQIEKISQTMNAHKKDMAEAIKGLAKGLDKEGRLALAEILRTLPSGFKCRDEKK